MPPRKSKAEPKPGTDVAVLETVETIVPFMPEMRPDGRTNVLPCSISDLKDIATIVRESPSTAKAVRDDAGACMAVAYAAADWRLNPVMVASKAYLVPVPNNRGGGHRLAWEAQLIITLGNSRAPLVGPLEITFHGEGTGRYCRVRGLLRGARKWSEYTSPTFAQIATKNSPQWFSDPDQQFSYYAQVRWFRRYAPEAILGLYSPGELEVDGPAVIGFDPYSAAEASPDTPEPSGGGLVKDAAKGEDGKPQREAEKLEPDDMPELREWLAEVQASALASKDVTEIENIWKAALDHKNHGRIKAYDKKLMATAYRAIEKHVTALNGPPKGEPAAEEDDGFPGGK